MKNTAPVKAEVDEELRRVSEELAAGKVKGPERLALLRRQAHLGDLGQALTDRARRAALAEQ